MKNHLNIILLCISVVVLLSCFDGPDISVPTFIPKSMPYEVEETGIDAHYENAIYLEWEEPASSDNEGILGYYVYRSTFKGGSYNFKKIATVDRGSITITPSDTYTDYTVSLDTTYYYYLKSYNDFGVSQKTSDTAYYELVVKAYLYSPLGDITDNQTKFYFTYSTSTADYISYFYMRLFYNDGGEYKIKYFVKTDRFDYSNSRYYIYLNSTDSHTQILLDSLSRNDSNERYLEKGQYKWRIDAVSSESNGMPETQGSESNWGYFEVK